MSFLQREMIDFREVMTILNTTISRRGPHQFESRMNPVKGSIFRTLVLYRSYVDPSDPRQKMKEVRSRRLLARLEVKVEGL